MPKVSIIVPVHNTEKYLQACVESLTAQTLADIEIILVENCSTDNSLTLCHKLSATDDRIKVVSIDKADLSTARNEGIRLQLANIWALSIVMILCCPRCMGICIIWQSTTTWEWSV